MGKIAVTLTFIVLLGVAFGDHFDKLREIVERDFDREATELERQQTLEASLQIQEIESERKMLELKQTRERKDMEKLHAETRDALTLQQTELDRQQKLLDEQRKYFEQEQKRQQDDLKARHSLETRDQSKEFDERQKTLKGLHEGQKKLLKRQQEDRKLEITQQLN